jgi:hypothetical protein
MLKRQLEGLSHLRDNGKIPSFTATDINGKTVSSSQLTSQVNVIFTWASWNYDSQNMLRKLNRLMDYVEVAYKTMLDNLKIGYKNLRDISNASDAEYNINGYRNSLREELISHIDDNKYEMGVFYMDVVNELERIGDFIINVSEALLVENNEA